MYEIFEKLLKERGVTAYRVAKDTGLNTAMFTSWKKGDYTPKQDKLQKIAEYFGVTVDYLMTRKDPKPESGLESFWDFFIKSAKSEGCELWKYERAGNYENKEPFYSENLSMDNMVTIFKQIQNDSGKMSQSASRTVKQINDYIIRHCKNIIQDILSGNDLISSEQDYFRFDDLLLESYRAADPGIQDSICKLLDIDNKTEALKKGSA